MNAPRENPPCMNGPCENPPCENPPPDMPPWENPPPPPIPWPCAAGAAVNRKGTLRVAVTSRRNQTKFFIMLALFCERHGSAIRGLRIDFEPYGRDRTRHALINR